jgi:transcription elongation factor GreA-like protein
MLLFEDERMKTPKNKVEQQKERYREYREIEKYLKTENNYEKIRKQIMEELKYEEIFSERTPR